MSNTWQAHRDGHYIPLGRVKGGYNLWEPLVDRQTGFGHDGSYAGRLHKSKSPILGPAAHSDWVCGADSTMIGCAFRSSVLTGSALGSIRSPTRVRSSNLPKIILPAVVCSTEVTAISTFLPISLRALSTTTMVPSSR